MSAFEESIPQQGGDADAMIAEYLSRATSACNGGDAELGMHLYLAAFGFASSKSAVPNEATIDGLKRAWSVACRLKERALAEYIFEKMEPYLTAGESAHCAMQLQALALDKLAEYGLTREAIAEMAGLPTDGSIDPSSIKLVHVGNIKVPAPPQPTDVEMPGDEDLDAAYEALLAEAEGGVVDEGPAAESSADGDGLNEGLSADADGFGESSSACAENLSEHADAVGESPDGVAAESSADVEGLSESLSEIAGSTDEALGIGSDAVVQTELEDGPFVAPHVTSDGIALGEGFGLRMPSSENGEPISPFEQMMNTLSKMMGDFERKNGERVVEPSDDTSRHVATRVPGELPEGANYADLVGYDEAIRQMQSFGIGMRDDPDYLQLVETLNTLYGMDGQPATDTLMFRALAREDATRFMLATANEVNLPVLRLSMDENLQGSSMLCLTVKADQAPKMNQQRTEIIGPAVVCLEDVDLWMAPAVFPGEEDVPWSQLLTRGAREAIQMIRSAVENPEVYVLASLSAYGEVDPFFCDILTPLSIVEIDVPTEKERQDIWHALVRDHPSLGGLRLADLVKYSANMPRADIYIAVREAIEEAYKQSLAMKMYLPVTYDNLLEKLSAYQPLESDEYKDLEDEVASLLRSELDTFNSVDSLLGLDVEEDDTKPLYEDLGDIDIDNPYFAL